MEQHNEFHATTIVAVRHDGRTAIAGDGQVTFGQHTVMKANARKVRRLYHDSVLAGFAGSVADAFTLFEKFEAKLEEFNGNLLRSSVELAKEWRTDKVLRRLEALLLVADSETLENDTVHCYLLHDLRGERGTFWRDCYASFNVGALWKRNTFHCLRIHVNDVTFPDTEYYDFYK